MPTPTSIPKPPQIGNFEEAIEKRNRLQRYFRSLLLLSLKKARAEKNV